jgi:hypothetical protein
MNEIKHAEYPGPEGKKFITNPTESLPEEKRQNNSGQKNDHKNCKDQEHPDLIECTQNEIQDFQITASDLTC